MRRKDVTRGSAPPQEDEDVDEREQREPSSKRGRYWNARKTLPKKKSVGSGMTLVSNASLFLIFASSILAVNHLTGGEILDQVRETISALTWPSKNMEEKITRKIFDTFDDVRRIDQSIDHATRYICNVADAKGMFAYEIKVRYGKARNTNDYNVLRHAGTIYSLIDSCYFNEQQAGVKEQYCRDAPDTVRKTVDWLVRETVRPVPDLDLVGIYKPHASHKLGKTAVGRLQYRLALGGQGLGMIAFSMANQIQPGSVPWDTVRQIGDFTVKHMQKEDGIFYPFWYPFHDPFGPSDTPKSLYYPGEAALGLIYLYESLEGVEEEGGDKSNGRLVYLEGAARGLEALANERESWSPKDIPPDHWALKATARILKHLPKSRHPKLLKHAASVVRMMHTRDMSRIAVDASLGVSSMATVLEAQFAMLPIFYENPSYYENVEETWCLSQKVAFLLCEAQDRDKPSHMLGGLPHVLKMKNEYEETNQTFVRRITGDDGRFRIDDTQHSLSAWLSYKEALESGLSEIDCSRVDLPPLIRSLFDGLAVGRKQAGSRGARQVTWAM